MVVFDNSILVLAFDENANPPTDPATDELLTECAARVDYLIKSLSKAKTRVLIPTPVMAEYLVRAGVDRDKRLAELTSSRVFVIAPFDIRAAVECAGIEDADYARLRVVPESEVKAKVKFDRQIIATAIARGATVIYTGDIGLASRAKRNNIEVVMTWELPLPPVDPQLKFEYGDDSEEGAQRSLAASPEWGSY
ncbi:type II toxin-antitoxin system VapC family toxin [Massilia sp. TWP1-3-3]|uniref:type II toxin-antitoxin system VapC family toxin n=1 Tax=Massilia sp. TWP1-3-3 TaxID=2804573 RepID=UPI003CE94675